MNPPVVVDRTSSGKEHFEVLDGLRGSAAFLIVIFHLFNYSFGFQGPWALIKHAYLAVDFFFALSGFVVAYAYDDRWTRMTTCSSSASASSVFTRSCSLAQPSASSATCSI